MAGAAQQPRRLYTPPLRPEAERICLLDAETARRRREPPDRFLAAAGATAALPNGSEFRFARADATWDRVSTFVQEERECCPFFAFEQWEEGDEVVLRITIPEGTPA